MFKAIVAEEGYSTIPLDFMDPINYLECFVTDGGNNRTGWSNEEFDALIAETRQTVDTNRRHALLQKAETIMMDEAVIAPIYSYTQRHLRAPAAKSIESRSDSGSCAV